MLRATTAHADERRPAIDPAALFAPGGVLSPGFVGAHSRSTAAPLDLYDATSHAPRVAALFNPALAPLGKWSARIEIAPLRAHALFVEASLVRIDVSEVRVTGTELDVGYHLFPFDQGLSGLYIGPRYLRATGESDVARGKVSGFGGDLGFQWVLGIVAINMGIGAAYAKVTIEPKAELLASPDVPDDVKAAVPSAVDTTRVVPLGTFGIGVAF